MIQASGSAPIDRMWQRVETARADSDTALFYDLLCMGEMLVKLIVSGVLAALEDDKERHRYRFEYTLVRASGIGDWVQVLHEALTGPAAAHFLSTATADSRDLTQNFTLAEEAWQRRAVVFMDTACREIEPARDRLPGKISLRLWFDAFAWLRNRTRGHGATPPGVCAKICAPVQESLKEISANALILRRPMAYLHQNLSGKYKVVPITAPLTPFAPLKSHTTLSYADGVYIALDDQIRPVHLLESNPDISDFFFVNGDFKGSPPTYQLQSYITDTRKSAPGVGYLEPPHSLPASHTEGRPQLDVQGNTFANIPAEAPDYVARPQLEEELTTLLKDDRRLIVTLIGQGGVGKTSLALHVAHEIANESTFFAIVWFSARDIDLLPTGPKLVRAAVLTQRDIAQQFRDLLLPPGKEQKGGDAVRFLADCLSGVGFDGALMFVFDNFETVQNPAELYQFIDTYIRSPNKVLITSRFRDFKGDYPINVGGMARGEFDELAATTARRLSAEYLLQEQYLSEVYDESDGHPYVVKVLLADAARLGRPAKLERVMASKEHILDALFERTFQSISVAAQRTFLTLCSWQSMVPRVAVEAILRRPSNEPMDVDKALDVLEQSSLIELVGSGSDAERFVRVPLAASVFGRRKLIASPMKPAIAADVGLLQAFGPAKEVDAGRGLQPGLDQMVRRIAGKAQGGKRIDEELAILEYIARKFPPAWLRIADLHSEGGESLRGAEGATAAVRSYLELCPHDRVAWNRLAELCRSIGDTNGEVHARSELALLSGASFEDLSSAAQVINFHLAKGGLTLAADQRRALIEPLLERMNSRLSEADAVDLSRMAWLSLNVSREEQAARYVVRGLQLDPSNAHCNKLALRPSLEKRLRRIQKEHLDPSAPKVSIRRSRRA